MWRLIRSLLDPNTQHLMNPFLTSGGDIMASREAVNEQRAEVTPAELKKPLREESSRKKTGKSSPTRKKHTKKGRLAVDDFWLL